MSEKTLNKPKAVAFATAFEFLCPGLIHAQQRLGVENQGLPTKV